MASLGRTVCLQLVLAIPPVPLPGGERIASGKQLSDGVVAREGFKPPQGALVSPDEEGEVLPGRLPLALTRTARTRDDSRGPFGPGMSHAYDVFVTSLSSDALLLTLPGNSRALFARQVDVSAESPE